MKVNNYHLINLKKILSLSDIYALYNLYMAEPKNFEEVNEGRDLEESDARRNFMLLRKIKHGSWLINLKAKKK